MEKSLVNRLEVKDTVLTLTQGLLFVREWLPSSPVSNEPLIMLHDSLGSVAQWRDFPAVLSQRLQRPVIAYDRLGFGQSSRCSRLPSYTFIDEEAEQVFPQLCRLMNIKRYSLLGHSVGGVMALTIAATDQKNCEAVVSISAQAFVEDRTLAGIRQALRHFGETGAFSKLEKWHGDKAQWVLDAWTETWLSSDFRSWNLDACLNQVTSRALIIHGDHDEYGSIAFPQHITSRVRGPVKMCILQDCGHLPHVEYNTQVVDLIDRFFSKSHHYEGD